MLKQWTQLGIFFSSMSSRPLEWFWETSCFQVSDCMTIFESISTVMERTFICSGYYFSCDFTEETACQIGFCDLRIISRYAYICSILLAYRQFRLSHSWQTWFRLGIFFSYMSVQLLEWSWQTSCFQVNDCIAVFQWEQTLICSFECSVYNFQNLHSH